MKAEDQYIIVQTPCYITRDGQGIITNRKLIEDDGPDLVEHNKKYYKVCADEIRYVVMYPCIAGGISVLGYPANRYLSAMRNECFMAYGFINQTRKYKLFLDNTYYKFYDDADEVIQNLIKFTKWLKNIPQTMAKRTIKEIMNKNEYLIKDAPDTLEWQRAKASQHGLSVKTRNSLNRLQRETVDERDLIE